MYCDAPGHDTLDPWMCSTLVRGNMPKWNDMYGLVTQRTQQEQMYSRWEKGAHRTQSGLWGVRGIQRVSQWKKIK